MKGTSSSLISGHSMKLPIEAFTPSHSQLYQESWEGSWTLQPRCSEVLAYAAPQPGLGTLVFVWLWNKDNSLLLKAK